MWSDGEGHWERRRRAEGPRWGDLAPGICLAALLLLIHVWHSATWRHVTATVSEPPSKCWQQSDSLPFHGRSIRFDGHCTEMRKTPHWTSMFELHVTFPLENGRPHLATLRMPWDPEHPPKPGDPVEIRVDPQDADLIMLPASPGLLFDLVILAPIAFGIIVYCVQRFAGVDLATPVMRVVLRLLGVVVEDDVLKLPAGDREDTGSSDAPRPFGRRRRPTATVDDL
jgi:hypothetical protein